MDRTPESEAEGDLTDELRQLGNNLKDTLQTAWGSEERRKVQGEIEAGLVELGRLLQEASDSFDAEAVGQEIKTGVEDIRQRLQTSEVENRVRQDLLKALQVINTELSKFKSQWSAPESAQDAPGQGPGGEEAGDG